MRWASSQATHLAPEAAEAATSNSSRALNLETAKIQAAPRDVVSSNSSDAHEGTEGSMRKTLLRVGQSNSPDEHAPSQAMDMTLAEPRDVPPTPLTVAHAEELAQLQVTSSPSDPPSPATGFPPTPPGLLKRLLHPHHGGNGSRVAASPAHLPVSPPQANRTVKRTAGEHVMSSVADVINPAFWAEAEDQFDKAIALNAVRQPPPARPVKVLTSIVLENLQEVDQKKEIFSMHGQLVFKWTDRRVRLPEGKSRALLDIDLKKASGGALWTPATVYVNGLQYKEEPKLVLLPGSELVLVRRFHGSFAVRLFFFYFPLDIQVLPVAVEAYTEPSEVVTLQPGKVYRRTQDQGGQWKVINMTLDASVARKISTGFDFDRVTAHIYVQRRWSKFRMTILLPQIVLLLLSYTTYFVDPTVLPARTALVMITLLSTLGYASSAQSELPTTGYMIWLDAVNAMVIFSSATAVLITVIVFWNNRKDGAHLCVPGTFEKALQWKKEEGKYDLSDDTTTAHEQYLHDVVPGRQHLARRIDLACRVLWPVFTSLLILIIFVLWPIMHGGFRDQEYARSDFD